MARSRSGTKQEGEEGGGAPDSPAGGEAGTEGGHEAPVTYRYHDHLSRVLRLPDGSRVVSPGETLTLPAGTEPPPFCTRED